MSATAGPSEPGPFEPAWKSLAQYRCPEWFRDAKFGIWAHWGPQSVPEYGDWYARFMYMPNQENWEGRSSYAYHAARYGHPSIFGYKDLIPLFTASRWKPEALMDLYDRAGARFFMSMGQHHDNFDMWDSRHQPWNAVNMGPRRDIVKEWREAAKSHGMPFGVSFHGEYAWGFFEHTRDADADGPMKGVRYDGWQTAQDGKGKWWEGYDPQDLYTRSHALGDARYDGKAAYAAFARNFLDRVRDLIEHYYPDEVYFDGGLPVSEEEGLRLMSDFYNSNWRLHGVPSQAVMACKRIEGNDRRSALVYDIENGVAADILPSPWQTDTSFDGWFFCRGGGHASTEGIVHMLVDVVSKNGCLMLNITQQADGTIQDYAVDFLKEMAAWMAVNGEAIHGTRPWERFGEGPNREPGGEKNYKSVRYTAEDIRFTTKGGVLYAILMDWPGGSVLVRSLPGGKGVPGGGIREVRMLGVDGILKWRQTEEGLWVELPVRRPCRFAYALQISS